ncbi:hypothetical protein PI95_034640 [Hassallia byssoidea VB512170]|uniref:Uncharacterized protein n=1 Tax=Hassallia byssoidea VB512170 TaxID=1304833 RepID=A0A846HQF8_9CYAN|nr:hypothetical protein [Hassalia byssoidea VB512170]
MSRFIPRHILSTIYTVDKQIQIQPDGNIQLDAEVEQRLQDVVRDLVKAVNISPVTKEVAHAG